MSIPISSLPKAMQDQVAAQLWPSVPAKAVSVTPKPLIRQKAGPALNKLETAFLGLETVKEWHFCPTRKWRFDYAWPKHKLALEVEGGVWNKGRHTRGSGFVKDMEKYNEAACLGWRIIRVQPDDLFKYSTRSLIDRCLSTCLLP